MLVLRGIDKTFPIKGGHVSALRDVDLKIESKSLTAILGASGSGKTTLLRIIAGFERPERGEVTLDGETLVGEGVFVRPERRGVGIVPQDGALFPHRDVAANVAFGLRASSGFIARWSDRRARAKRVAQLLDMVGLVGYERRRPEELSGGQQQRVALARALAPNPRVIVLDEPFSAIDAALRSDLSVEVRDLLRQLNTTAVLVTHDQSEALSLADTVAVMRAGRVVQVGSPSEIYEKPVDTDIARFIGDAVIVDGKVTGRDGEAVIVKCVLGDIAASAAELPPSGSSCRVLIRPENVLLGDHGVPARVVSSSYFGHDLLATLRLGHDGDGPQVQVRTNGVNIPQPGTTTCIRASGLAHILVM